MKYVNPQCEILLFITSDVITVSREIDNDLYIPQPDSWNKVLGLEI